MNTTVTTISAGSEDFSSDSGAFAKRLLADRLAHFVFTFGGWAILLSICAILLVIALEAVPLFVPPKITPRKTLTLDPSSNSLFIGDYLETGMAIAGDGSTVLMNFADKSLTPVISAISANLTSVTSRNSREAFFGTDDGRVLSASVSFIPKFNNGVRTIQPSLVWGEQFNIFNTLNNEITHKQPPIIRLAQGSRKDTTLLLAQTGPRELVLYRQNIRRGLMGGGTKTEDSVFLTIPSGSISAIAMDSRSDFALVGTSTGSIFTYELRGTLSTNRISEYRASENAISAVDFALGGRTLLVGDSLGAVSSWLFVRKQDNTGFALKKINTFEAHQTAIKIIEPSQRNKVFITGTDKGDLKIHYATSGKTLASIKSPLAVGDRLNAIRLAPKGNGIFAHASSGDLFRWDFYNPHPEISLKTLFGPVHYEGFSEADYIWQSSGGTDEFEPKLSLLPLLLGTLKGTFYALIFSVPLALLGAFYTSQFMSPHMKSVVKPSLEVMAALPSVVIGFVAGLWLAPLLEPHLLAIFCTPICLIIALVIVCLLYWQIQSTYSLKHRRGIELLIAIPMMALTLAAVFPLAGFIESLFFGGDFNQWLFSNHDIRVDQRNSIIAGIAVGFAVIPIIFTISEDCLSSVPRALSAGSLALGATRWQTSMRVVFPVAAPGIFAAIMIGLGRAVGETMIVLMATGNTPLMDFSAFTGFRALSANIAVELPEAPQGGTLYRVLFLTAFILFVMTFMLNTLSEFVRIRLRKKFGGV